MLQRRELRFPPEDGPDHPAGQPAISHLQRIGAIDVEADRRRDS